MTAEAEAISQGFEPSSNPGIAKLEALTEGSEQLFAATDEAIYLLKEAQIQLADINEEVGPKLRFLGAHLRARYRKQSKSDIRVLLRTYGFTYKSPRPSLNHSQEPNQEPNQEQSQNQNEPIICQEPIKTKLTSPVDQVEQNALNEHVEPVTQSYPKPTTNRDPGPSTESVKKGTYPSASPGSPQPNPPNQRSQKRTHRKRRRNKRHDGPSRKDTHRGRPTLSQAIPGQQKPGHERNGDPGQIQLKGFFNRERHQKRERFLRAKCPP